MELGNGSVGQVPRYLDTWPRLMLIVKQGALPLICICPATHVHRSYAYRILNKPAQFYLMLETSHCLERFCDDLSHLKGQHLHPVLFDFQYVGKIVKCLIINFDPNSECVGHILHCLLLRMLFWIYPHQLHLFP